MSVHRRHPRSLTKGLGRKGSGLPSKASSKAVSAVKKTRPVKPKRPVR